MRGGRADRYRPALLYTYIYGEGSGPYPSSVKGWGLAPTGPYMPISICMEIIRALPFVCQGVGASPHRPPHAYTYMYGEIVRAQPFICHGVGASPHRPPPPFLVLTQEKEAKEGQGYGHPS